MRVSEQGDMVMITLDHHSAIQNREGEFFLLLNKDAAFTLACLISNVLLPDKGRHAG